MRNQRGRRRNIWLGAGFIAAVVMALAIVSFARGAPAQSPRPRLRGTDVFARGMRPAPQFTLRNQYGRMMTTRSLRGHIVAITFLDSHCRQECPIAGRELAAVQRQLGRHSPLIVVVISVDPSQDTPGSARAFMREAGLRGTWYWLFGTRRQLAPVWIKYGIEVRPTRKDILHTAAVYLMDRTGSVRVADGVPLIPSQLAGSVRALAAG